MSELWRLDAWVLAAMIAKREVSSAEVVEAHLDRIEAVNPAVNAVTRVLTDEARAEAAAADRPSPPARSSARSTACRSR